MSDSPRAGAIYYCPFCAEEDLRPVEDPAGAWECRACARVFTVSFARLEAAHIPGRVAEEQALQHDAVRKEQP